ncbi:hypothetical protein Tco_0952005 [Tanacetum coccineum]|uniref:Uncharacterized protein n=1 Tax=Tanacetum coccineum TaxID=301880 RepID=A0ABQ5DVV8_9ASTR
MGGIFSLEARDLDTEILSAPESNNTLARCWFRRNIPAWQVTVTGSRLLPVSAFLTQGMVSSISIIFSWGGSISPEGFLSFVLLWLVIIVAVVGVSVMVVVVIIVAVVVVESSSVVGQKNSTKIELLQLKLLSERLFLSTDWGDGLGISSEDLVTRLVIHECEANAYLGQKEVEESHDWLWPCFLGTGVSRGYSPEKGGGKAPQYRKLDWMGEGHHSVNNQ